MTASTVEVTADDLQALQKIINYLWHDEEKHYRSDKDPSHVFLSLKVVNDLAYRVAEELEDA